MLVGRGVTIGAGARIVGPTVIGHDTIIGAGATIEASVIWEEARIGDGAQHHRQHRRRVRRRR